MSSRAAKKQLNSLTAFEATDKDSARSKAAKQQQLKAKRAAKKKV